MPDISPLGAMLVAVLVVVLVMSAWTLHKVRRTHLATFALREDLTATRREVEALFPQVQALLALEYRLQLQRPLPALRGWTGSPDFLLALADEVLASGPRTVVECSSGASTLVIARCLQRLGRGHVYSLEHDPEFATKTRAMVKQQGLDDFATVVDAPLQSHTTPTPWYDLSGLPRGLTPIDLLVVDGPPAAVAPLARAPALPQFLPRMAAVFAVMIDDAARPDEVEMVRGWMQTFPGLERTDIAAEKGLVLLRGHRAALKP